MHQIASVRGRLARIVALCVRVVSVVAVLVAASTVWAASYTKFVVFGDSLSDVGNAYIYTGMVGSPQPPSPPYYEGRASNGPLWVEDLANKMGVPSAAPFLVDGTGTNYAAGSTTTGSGFPNLGYMVGTYLYNVSNAADPNALYIVWSGANDFFSTIDADPSHAVANCTAGLSTWAGNVSGAVNALHAAGATNFLVPNLPPLGSTPKLSSNPDKVTINSLASSFNSTLSADLSALSLAHNDLLIQTLDVYSLFNQVIANPNAFGFDNVTDAAMTTPGADASKYLFWDSVHPTAAGHSLLAQAVPEPNAFVLSAAVCIGLLGWRWRLGRTAEWN